MYSIVCLSSGCVQKERKRAFVFFFSRRISRGERTAHRCPYSYAVYRLASVSFVNPVLPA